MSLLQQFRIPKVQLVLILLLVALSAFLHYPLLTVARITILSVLFTVGSDLLLVYLRKHTLFVPHAAMVTGLILGLTINPHLSWYGILLISIIAVVSKHFVQISRRHIFNPAAFGLIVGNVLLNDSVSWWGVSFQVLKLTPLNIVLFLLLLLPILVSGIRMKRIGSISSFLLTFSILLFLQHQTSPLTILTDPTVLFFALTMLPEPMTSPITLQRQILYGGFVAIAATVFFYLPFDVPDGLLPFLLLGNLAFFKFR
ncbi:RnfABCDGE type electron transport complex subunit D [Candidatus Microgenomates bacterium]|nr:RnfABCDGE type electron transport complex subunit D [Candidatus Microgenomates bacterium]